MKNHFRVAVIALCCALVPARATGQTNPVCDTLFFRSGLVIPARLKSVGRTAITYYNCDQGEGSPFVVQWPMVREIHYANGSKRNQWGNILPQPPHEGNWNVETTDDNNYIGVIREQDSEKIVLETPNLGKITLLRSAIHRMTPIRPEQIKNGEVWYDSPHATRYLFGPNGYGLRQGEGYYQNVWVLFNQISYGVTENFTLGVGLVPLFLFSGPSPVWLTPKFSFPIQKDKVNLGVGALFATVLGDRDYGGGGSFGVAYGQLTIGSRDQNVNFGLGYGYAGDSWANSPTLSFSTMLRGSKKFAFVSENYLFDTGDNNVGLLSAGCRFLGRRIAIDGALVAPVGVGFDTFIAIPWLGLNVPIGAKR